jgi:hypothetical protein
MSLYTRIQDGVVAELFTPPPGSPPIDQMFNADLTWIDATVVSPAPQVGWTYNGTAFAAPPPPPPPTLQEQAGALLGFPVAIVCTSVPALNGSYPIDPAAQMQITGIASAINAGLGLPGGGANFNWPDATGTPHAWPAAQFTEFAKAVMNFVYAAAQVAQGHGATLPSATLTIA